ncbi:MAG: RNA polymerase sporulation sigma factor SigK [Oscillospiraceae bacterium]|nr:RNA polymerase sporulation sigma factor SigK [Oscillospiraceae bacterium]
MFIHFIENIAAHFLCFALHLSGSGSFPPPLSAAEETHLLKEKEQGNEDARRTLIEHNLRLVAHIIKKYYSSYSDQEDLISIGTIGLIKAINTFDSSKGTRLATYGARCIENEILMHFRNQKKTSQNISMNDPIDIDGEGNPLTLTDIICTPDTIADDLDIKIKSEKLYQYIEELADDREKRILIMRYGLYGKRTYSQREVAKELHISRSYVSRLEKKALTRLKKQYGCALDASNPPGN